MNIVIEQEFVTQLILPKMLILLCNICPHWPHALFYQPHPMTYHVAQKYHFLLLSMIQILNTDSMILVNFSRGTACIFQNFTLQTIYIDNTPAS